MAVETIDSAIAALQKSGGLVTVVLGTGVDAPDEWGFHPRVHWLVARDVKRHAVAAAIPSNTRLLIFTENIHHQVYQPLQDERKRRRLPYLTKQSQGAVEDQLTKIFPKTSAPFNPIPPIDVSKNGDSAPAASAEPDRSRGFLKTFLEKHVDFSPAKSTAEEARRVFKLAQLEGVQTTLGSVTQGIAVLKRKRGIGSRPDSATAHQEVGDSVSIQIALEAAIAGLQAVLVRVKSLDTSDEGLRKENDDLRARIKLLKEAFGNID